MLFLITFEAIDTRDGKLKKWYDTPIEAVGHFDAEFKLRRLGKYHCRVEGVILRDINGSTIEAQKLLN